MSAQTQTHSRPESPETRLAVILLVAPVVVGFLVAQFFEISWERALLIFSLATVALAVYAAPVWIAHRRRHPERLAITLLSLLAGWTFAGWIIALVWSVKRA